MGSVVTRDDALHERIKLTPHAPGPGRGAATTPSWCCARCRRWRCATRHRTAPARALAAWLAARPEVRAGAAPGRWPVRPGHAHWQAHCTAAAGLFSILFDERFSAAQVDAFVDALRLFRIGYSWAGPVSLVVPYDLAAMRSPEARRATTCAATWCASRSVSKRWTTCRPISRRRWRSARLNHRAPQAFGPDETLCLISRPFSRSQSRFFSVLRLSCCGLALGERDLGLDAAALVVQVQRHQREALLLDLADQAADLLLCISSFLVRSASGWTCVEARRSALMRQPIRYSSPSRMST